MDPLVIGIIAIIALVIAILAGVHIAVALGLISFLGILLISGSFPAAVSMIGNASYESIREYVYTVIPLFMLMGTLMSGSGVAADLFKLMNHFIRKMRIRGGLAIATVLGNAIFAAVTGVSIASAALFAKVAYPEMKRFNYADNLSLGTIAGSSVLGMLIPPSGLFIIYGVLTGDAIGKLFIAGILPGIVVAVIFCFIIVIRIRINPALENTEAGTAAPAGAAAAEEEPLTLRLIVSALSVIAMIFLILGGIWFGWFTPTEAAAIGCVGALIVSLIKGIGFKGIWKAIWDAASASAPVFLLLITGSMYARLIAFSGILSKLNTLVQVFNLPGWAFLSFAILVWLLLGFIVDSTSILLITVPLFTPVLLSLGYDPIWIAVITIIAVEIGLLTPPFGMCVYATKASVPNPDVTIEEIFNGSIPYAIGMFVGLIIIILFPFLSTLLPGMM